MEAVKDPGEMYGAAPYAAPRVVGPKLQGVLACGKVRVIPGQGLGMELIAGEVSLGIPKGARLDAHNAQSRLGQFVKEHSPSRPQTHDNRIHLLAPVFALAQVGVALPVVMIAVMLY